MIELKAVPCKAEFAGKLNLYLLAVDAQYRHVDDQPTIELLLCKSKNRLVAEYALRNVATPIGVADWQARISESLPDDLKGSLPTVEQIEAELSDELITPATRAAVAGRTKR